MRVTDQVPPDGGRRYAMVAVLLHWSIAALILVQLMLAWRMKAAHTPETFAVFQLHKSVGITILALSLLRLIWRLTHRPPPLPEAMAGWEKILARVTHWGFYLVMIGMPLTGWLMVSTDRLRLPTLLYGRIPWPDLPGFASLSDAARLPWREAGESAHASLAILFGLLFVLHVAGALKHQLKDRDEVLGRMAPGAQPGRRLEPRLLLIGFGVAAALALGLAVRPPLPAAKARGPADASIASGPSPAGGSVPVWQVEAGSVLGFTTSWSSQPVQGRFDRWRAEITFAPDSLDRSHVKVSVDLASVNTGDGQRDAVLPRGDWLDAEAHPQAVFTADRFERRGPDRFIAHGKLDLKGVSRPLDLPFRLTIKGSEAEVEASASIDRTVYGVGQGEWEKTDQIPAKVAITVSLRARRAG